jgi:hypothetical protein
MSRRRFPYIYLFYLTEKGDPGDLFRPTPEAAYEKLKELTGQDFGHDAEAWRRWF